MVFQGNVTVTGRLERMGEFDDYHLTMVSTQHLPGTHRYWFHFEGDEATNGSVGVELALVHNSIYLYE
ncbi:MAG: hypothetical protein GWN18_15595, partial [Thermoplasmata archaeon]|nr:hypothetical protein [Thermoplasmata archaeon]